MNIDDDRSFCSYSEQWRARARRRPILCCTNNVWCLHNTPRLGTDGLSATHAAPAMEGSSVPATRIYCVLFCTIIKAVISTGLGKCPVYPPLPNYDIQRMTGTWYEVERSFYLVEITASCTEVSVSLNERGYLLITINTVNKWTDSPSTTHGIGIPSYNGSSIFRYKLNNRMPYIIGRMLPGAGVYNVLFTDYTQFAIVWSCTSVSIAHSDRIWVLGRRREIEAPVRAQIYAIMEELRLDPDRLIISKNNNCTDIADNKI